MAQKKPKGRSAKRMAFYSLNRRKTQGRSVLKQIRAAMPVWPDQVSKSALPLSLIKDEWE